MININEIYSIVDTIAEVMFEYRKPTNSVWTLDYCVLKEDGFYLNMFSGIGTHDELLIPEEYYSLTIEQVREIEKGLYEKEKIRIQELEDILKAKDKEEWEKTQRHLYETLKKKFENQ